MIVAFTQILESRSGYVTPEVLSGDMYYWLNEAIRVFVEERFRQFEQSQRITDDIRTLVVEELAITTSHTVPTFTTNYLIDRIDFPIDYLYLLNHSSELFVANSGNFDYTVTANKRVPNAGYTDYSTVKKRNKVAQHDDIHIMLRDPFNRTTSEFPLSTVSDDGINVYTDLTFIVDQVIISYLKRPAEVSDLVDSDLPVFIHRKIVEMAVSQYIQPQSA